MVEKGLITEAMRQQKGRLLIIAANRDGIVPEATALSPQSFWGGEVSLMKLGNPRVWYAHADIFVGREAPEVVFDPVAEWLRAQ